MNTPHPVFVLVVVALLGTVGLEYGLEPTTVDIRSESQSLSTPHDSRELTPTPSPDVETTVLDVPAPTDRSDPVVRMRVGRVAACGATCREVTAHLHNDGSVDLTNVDAYTTVYAGDEIVWVDAERVERVAAGDRYTTTKQVQIGHGELLKIHSNDGVVTVETVIEFDQGSTVVTERIDVV